MPVTVPAGTMHCTICQGDLTVGALPGSGSYEGRPVHLADTGPRHADVAAHPLKQRARYKKPIPAAEHPAQRINLIVARASGGLTAPPGVQVWTDVSEWQGRPADGSYTWPFLAYRVSLSTTITDAQAAGNIAWSVGSHLTGHIGYHVWYPGNEAGQVAYFAGIARRALADPRFAIMIDCESWSGQIGGDHSGQLNDLATRFAALVGGNQKRVKRYGNSGDLASLWPNPLPWLGTIKAAYSAVAPPEPWDGWQYSDGQTTWPVQAGFPRQSAPWGAVDHNAFFGTTADMAARYGVTAAPPPPPVIGDEPMILLHSTPGGGIGALAPTGIYHYSGTEWAAVSAIRNALPAAVRDQIMPYIGVTDAQFNALPKLADDMAQVLGAVSADQAATIAAIKAAAPPTAQQISDVVVKNLPPGVQLNDAQLATIAAGVAKALPTPPAYGGTGNLTVTLDPAAAHAGPSVSGDVSGPAPDTDGTDATEAPDGADGAAPDLATAEAADAADADPKEPDAEQPAETGKRPTP